MRTHLAVVTLCWASASWAQSAWRWVDESGQTHYTDDLGSVPPGAQAEPTDGQDISTIEAPPVVSGDDYGDEQQADEQQTFEAPQVTSVDDFVPALEPYGQWVDVDGQRAWRPSVQVVGSNFVPYSTGGHWVRRATGWVWETNWPWGWAAFHYGNWWQSPAYGWVWYPGVRWAPAWVSWRHGGGFTSWAPTMPRHIQREPCWSTVRNEHFLRRGISNYYLPRTHAAVAANWNGSVSLPHGPPPRAFISRPPPNSPFSHQAAPPPPLRSSGFGPPPSGPHNFRPPPPAPSGQNFRSPPPTPSGQNFRSPPAPPPSQNFHPATARPPNAAPFGGPPPPRSQSGGGFGPRHH